MYSRSANDLTKIKIPLDELQPSQLFVSQRLEAQLPEVQKIYYSDSTEKTLRFDDLSEQQQAAYDKDLPAFVFEFKKKLTSESTYSVAGEIVENCRSVRDNIEAAASKRIQEITKLKELFLKKLNDYEIKRIRKFTSKSTIQFIDSDKLLNKCSTPFASMYHINNSEASSQESVFVDESCINDELIKFNMNTAQVKDDELGELVVETISQPIVYDANIFQKISIAKLFSQDKARPNIDDFEIEIQNGNYYSLYTNPITFETKYICWNEKKGLVVLLKVPNTLTVIGHKQKNDLLILNYIEQKRQEYYIRLIRINEKIPVEKPVEYLRILRADDKDLENLFLIGADEHIFCSSSSGIHMLDWNLNIIKTFGQTKNINEPYYFGDLIRQIELKQKKYFWLNENSLNITNSNDGILLKSIKLKADKFFFDSKDCLIIFSESSQTIWFINIDGRIICKSRLAHFQSKISSIYIDEINDTVKFLDKKKLELNLFEFHE